MPSPLLETKLYVPRPRRSLVSRPRLQERLTRGAESRLTLLSAPAGFGKTTLLAEWLSAQQRSVAWLSLEESDSRPSSFWTYLVAALQTAVPAIGSSALLLLRAAQVAIRPVLAALLNELSTVEGHICLVLDDYHLVEGPGIQDDMAYLLEHLPPQVHLVISTRADPTLSLARLRARGELVEIRAVDLRFTLDEVATLLNDSIGLDLSAHDIAVLELRTEGWVAALQLAALSMQGRDDAGAFVAGFAGDDRYIVDYLVDEVLERQPEPVRRFLVQTSVLDRLSGPLCDAVTGQSDSKAMLESLDRANLFVVPLDDSRRWYRYHHLFADVLHAHLSDESPDEIASLHHKASGWYEQNRDLERAVRHALACGDVDRAAGMVELAIPALRMDRQEATIRGWLDAFPDEVIRARPVLAVGFIGALMASGKFDGVEERLQDVEQRLQTTGDRDAAGMLRAEMVVVDEEELPRLPAAIQMYRAALALVRDDIPATIGYAQSAIEHAAEGDDLIRAAASALQGLALWSTGDLVAAHHAYSASVRGLQRAGHFSDVLGCSITLADIRSTQGRLTDALRTYELALRLGVGHDVPLRGTADMFVGMSQIACERGDLPTAEQYLRRAREMGEHTWLPQNPYRWRVAMAGVREAGGDLEGALDLLDEAQRVYVGDFSPNVRPVPALRARVLAAQGRLDDARAWARGAGLTAGDDVSYIREFEHITLAMVLLAQYRTQRSERSINDAEGLLQRLLEAAEAAQRTGSVIEILALQALAHHARGDIAAALAPLERAASLAEAEGYVRVFLSHGPPMHALLRTAAKQNSPGHYVHRLRLACNDNTVPTRRVRQSLVEPLSGRELDVLRLLGSDLNGPDIARELVVSVNTLRTHTKSIYAKLGVNSRRAAVREGAQLNLLSRSRER